MGFKRNAPTLVLTFEGELSGLQVETRTVGRRKFREISQMAEDFGDERPVDDEAWDAFERLCTSFEEVLLAWNLETDDGPVPCNATELDNQGIEFTLALVCGWMVAVEKYMVQLSASAAEQLQAQGVPDFDESQIPMT